MLPTANVNLLFSLHFDFQKSLCKEGTTKPTNQKQKVRCLCNLGVCALSLMLTCLFAQRHYFFSAGELLTCDQVRVHYRDQLYKITLQLCRIYTF